MNIEDCWKELIKAMKDKLKEMDFDYDERDIRNELEDRIHNLNDYDSYSNGWNSSGCSF